MKIVVTGANGFLGRHLLPILQSRYGGQNVVALSRKDYDLTSFESVLRMLEAYRPEVVVHLAAYVGGIGANRTYPADFFFRNIQLTSLMFEAAARFGLRKLIYPMGGCSYPAQALSPISEESMWEGYPQVESAPYSVAKKTALVARDAYRAQYGLDSTVIIPGNMYGEFDNFSSQGSHVIPALIRRFHEAKLANSPQVVMWGSGTPVRDFVYAGDVVAMFPFFIENPSTEPMNLSSGRATSILELAESIRRLTRYSGELVWDRTKPDGQMVKVFDITRMSTLGLSCPTSLEEGLARTIAWFEKNYETVGDGLRLADREAA
ncbi:MAG: NAD-dependent epimerase/dehydratase family protein [Bryobacteraceae bacterium]|nr:NAD-dependent epimerase/dehydratase family protein [Bryobacteraceae bacterium]